MSIYSILPALLCLAIALLTASWIGRMQPPVVTSGRFSALDGLRGYLAFFVFLHHTTVWHGYVRTGAWEPPPSHIYTHFGQSSVALFFMITGLLFWSKLLDARQRPLDWLRLYVSRVLRLTPLYLFAMTLIAALVIALSGGRLHTPIADIVMSAIRWLTFTIAGAPDINGVHNTFTMIAMVTWSLKYEWLFYLALPLFALLLSVRVPKRYVIMSVLTAAACLVVQPKLIHLGTFLGGVLTAYAVRSPKLCATLSGRAGSALAWVCIAAAVYSFGSAEHPVAIALLTAAFVIIACGNTLGGVLTTRSSRVLGEISYGIYLLHGFVLFTAFELMLGRAAAANLSPLIHWGVAALCTPMVVVISYATFRMIETPAMAATNRVTQWIQYRLGTWGLSRPTQASAD